MNLVTLSADYKPSIGDVVSCPCYFDEDDGDRCQPYKIVARKGRKFLLYSEEDRDNSTWSQKEMVGMILVRRGLKERVKKLRKICLE